MDQGYFFKSNPVSTPVRALYTCHSKGAAAGLGSWPSEEKHEDENAVI